MTKRSRRRVAPPAPPSGWEARFGTKEAEDGWEDLYRVAAASLYQAYEVLTLRPDTPMNPRRQHRLKGQLSNRMVHGKNLEQWQYEVTGSGRIWYCPDPDARIVWVVYASPQHPRAT